MVQTGRFIAKTPNEPQLAPTNTELVTIPLLVLGPGDDPLTDVDQREIRVYENNKEQKIESFSRNPDAPLKVGFLIDVSHSEAGAVRALISQGGAKLLGVLLHKEDFGFVAAFGSQASLVTPSTSNLSKLEQGFNAVFTTQQTKGGTALFDAIYWACQTQLGTAGDHHALIIFSDMLDNASEHTSDEAIKLVQHSKTIVYTVVLGKPTSMGAKTAKLLGVQTAGLSFAVPNLGALKEVMDTIRIYLMNCYTVAYRARQHRSGAIRVQCARVGVRVIAPPQRY